MTSGRRISGTAASGAAGSAANAAGSDGSQPARQAARQSQRQPQPHHSLAARPGGQPPAAPEAGALAPRSAPSGGPPPRRSSPGDGDLHAVVAQGWRLSAPKPASRLGNPALSATASGSSSLQGLPAPVPQAGPARPVVPMPYVRTDFSRPSDHPTFTFLEMDSLAHLMRLADGAAAGSVQVNLHGISEAQFRAVMHTYGQTRDMATVFNALPPGSVSIGLHRQQIETAANAYLQAVADNEQARSRQAAAPLVISLSNCIQDPFNAAYAAIGGNDIPRSVFERYISPQGLTEFGRSELERLSRAGTQ